MGWKRPSSRRHLALEMAAALLVVLYLGGPTLLYPFGRDQGEYAYTASAALAGKVVYRDVFDVKPPLTHIVHEAALLTFGHSMAAIRIFDLLWQCATVLTIVWIARRCFRRKFVGLAAGTIYAVLYYSASFWGTAQTDGFIGLPAALAMAAFLVARDRDRDRDSFACGLWIGVAVLFKYPIGILLPFLAGLAILPRDSRSLRRGLLLGLGFAVPLTVCVAVMVGQGAFDDFLQIQRHFISHYNGRRLDSGGSLLGPLFHPSLANATIWFATAAAVVGLIRKRQRPELEIVPVVLWLAAALIHLVVQQKYYGYHRLPLLGPQSILIAYMPFVASDAACAVWRPMRTIVAVASAVLFLGMIVRHPAPRGLAEQASLHDLLAGRRSLPTAAEYEAAAPSYGVGATIAAARYLREHSGPDDKVFIWGFETTVYFLAERTCASRFIYNFPLYGDFGWPELRDEFLAEMDAAPPLYLVVVHGDAMPWVTGTGKDSADALKEFEGLSGLLDSRYRWEADVEGFAFHRRIQ
jgi:hypothetical protein